MSKTILYIGNNLSKKTGYISSMDDLCHLFRENKYTIIQSSDKSNKFFRILDMLFTIVFYSKKIDFVLIDVFSTFYFYGAFLTSQWARILGLKYIPILHGGNLPNRIENSKRLSNFIFRNSYKNIAPSNYLKYVFEKKGYSTVLVPNILNIENYNFRERLYPQPKILWVRAFRHLYNPTMAIQVLYYVKKKHPKAVLCMVGPEKDDSIDEVKSIVKKYNLENSVEFTGVLSKEKWIKKSHNYDIFINTTNFDNTPVSVMEAMALGLVVVSTNVGGMPYLISDKQDGVLIPEKNPKKMANEIKLILNGNYPQLTQNARRKVEGFSAEKVIARWNEILY